MRTKEVIRVKVKEVTSTVGFVTLKMESISGPASIQGREVLLPALQADEAIQLGLKLIATAPAVALGKYEKDFRRLLEFAKIAQEELAKP